MSFITRFLFCLLLLNSSAVYAVDSCRTIFGIAENQNQKPPKGGESDGHLFLEEITAAKAVKGDPFQSPAFESYLEAHGMRYSWRRVFDRKSLLREYFSEKFREISANLESLRNKSLSDSLTLHGVPSGDASAIESLQAISKQNLNRLMANFKSRDESEIPEAAPFLDNVLITFIHNTDSRLASGRPSSSLLLSSSQLRSFGFDGGKNSRNSFNRELLKSDDNVFFDVVFGFKDKPVKSHASIYGKWQLAIPDHEAAGRIGWLSPFVMYPRDLVTSISSFAPQEARELYQLMKAKWPQVWAIEEDSLYKRTRMIPTAKQIAIELARRLRDDDVEFLLRGQPELWQRILANMHHADFSVADFNSLVRSRLVASLAELRTADVDLYQKDVERLRTGRQADIENLIARHVFGPLHLPFWWEFKVPVAVPIKELKMIEPGN